MNKNLRPAAAPYEPVQKHKVTPSILGWLNERETQLHDLVVGIPMCSRWTTRKVPSEGSAVMARGGVLPMWWVIHMCRGFDPLFSLWQDRARSFWGIFLIHQQQSYLLGYKNYQFLQKSIFLAPNSIFSSIFLGPIFSGQRHTPISFQAEYYPPGVMVSNIGFITKKISLSFVFCKPS